MPSPRFHAPGAAFAEGAVIRLSDKARHHAGRVLRMLEGDEAVLFDGAGSEAAGPIAFGKDGAFVTVRRVARPALESPARVTLVQALVAPEKMDWIVEKAVETGVVAVVVAPARRSSVKLPADRLEKRLAHWREVAVAACEQCGRDVVPEVRYERTLEAALSSAAGAGRYILALGGPKGPRLAGLSSVAFAVGPEGGFDEAEVAAAVGLGWQPALLGPRVMRTETAGIVAAALANAAAGDIVLG
ncbi:MAG: 16S rRNA (uracil(1498)-N(3))-methyltransferase [Duodenibacillus sp.]|nr:16S rRNA (uracil(1498)-N(3))-methyltransferase [Duodenibacillus sp.]